MDKKEIKKEIANQISKLFDKEAYLTMRRVSNGYIVGSIEYEEDGKPYVDERVFKCEFGGYLEKGREESEKKATVDVLNDILEWMGYQHEKYNHENIDITWDLIGDHVEELPKGLKEKLIKKHEDKIKELKEYYK